MNREEADQLAARMVVDDPDIIINGVRAWAAGFSAAPSFVVAVDDPRSGSSANIKSAEEWEKLMEARRSRGATYTIP